MANYIVCLIIQRLILPILLTTCCLLRPVGLSLPYLLFLFYLPFVPVASLRSFKGHTGYYLKILLFFSVILCLVQISFQILLAVLGNDLVQKCEFLELLLRHVGLVRLDNLDVISLVQWLAPEIVMFVGSIVVFIVLRKASGANVPTENGSGGGDPLEAGTSPIADNILELSPEKWKLFVGVGKVLSLLALCLTGALQPSIPSAIYFIVFLGAATWWGCNKELERAFAIVLRVTVVFLGFHITAFLGYQNPWPQELLTPNTTIPRVLGFSAIYSSSCGGNDSDIRIIDFDNNLDLDHYLSPISLIICYFILSITSVLLLGPQPEETKQCSGGPIGFSQLESGAAKVQRQVSFRMQRKNILRKTLTSDKWRGAARKVKGYVCTPGHGESSSVPNERTPLMRGGTRKVADSKPDVTSPTGDSIPMTFIGEVFAEEEENEDGENEIGFLEQIGMAAANIATFIYKNSYIFTNVVMMAWSIVYHSWVGFVLLIWANLIWIIPNQRKNMLKTTPYLVAYAEFLLLATYLYGMDLTDDELPSNVDINGINLPQIGFIKYPHYPVGPIAIKSFFNVMFWASLRQMLQEKRSEKQSRGLADMVAPLQLTVGAATANLPKKATTESAFITKMGKLINTFLIKFWIWIVVATLFVCGTAGTQMTGFRIVYMALFLVFVLTFQFSFSRWRKFMYGFWLVVIVYSIIILVLVYTYQFDKTSSYWTEYLHISPTLQRDIGMERYATKELFLHLVTPTLIVIITVVQLHYCHSKFLELSEIAEGPEDDISKASSVAYGTFAVNKSDDENEENEENEETEDVKAFLEDIKIRKLSKQEMKNAARKLLDKVIECLEVVLLFVEIHFFKVMLFSAFILAVHGVQLIHAGFVFLSAIGLRSKTEVQLMVTRVASLISAILLITTMMYQVDYIDHNNYESNCTNSTTEDITNNAVWFGFNKADTTRNLTDLIRPYLIYIAIVSVHAVIILRQTIKRIKANKTPRTPTVVFKKIKRSDADRDIPHLLKYLVNYGFYKFGIEVCLVGFVSVIGTRMDLMACFYTVWLCLLFYLPREQLIKFWTYATYFLTAAIPIQYIILVGLPPGLCWEYPWDNVDFLEDFTIWAMLPDYSLTFKTKSKFLILDFILLLLMCRQLIVFRIEARYENSDVQYPGGSNKSVLNDIDQLGQVLFVNPTHDFIDKIRNYLDICKRFIFVIFFWATLAIVFLTGTNRVNLLSIGYIAGSFVFLWSGTDFYLRPIHTIMKWWNYLIAYNVSVVTIKTMIQMIGCLFLKLLQKQSTCWLVQMFGITCICSTKNLTPKPQSEDTCYVPIEDSGLFWDGVCFTFLIIQRRLFSSHYFCHVINEAKASLILASRGNELIEELRVKESSAEVEREAQILLKIKSKMDRIKATQQRVLEENEPKHHAAEGTAPLARSHSMSSGNHSIGYHTPIEDEEEDVAESMFVEGEGLSEIPTDFPGISRSRAGSFIATQAPSPSSAVMTVSLEAYLDPHRISYGSPGDYEMLPRISSPDETYPVFSPPPFDEPESPQIIDQNMLVPPNMNGGGNSSGGSSNGAGAGSLQSRRHRRVPSLNTVSWPNPNELSVSPRSPRQGRMSIVAGQVEFDEDDDGVDDKSLLSPKFKSPRRRKSSVGTSVAQDDITMDPTSRRRSSFIPSWAIDDEDEDCLTTATRPGRRRKFSWGAVGEKGLRDSVKSARSASSRSPVSHHESIRSGDYYMFEDVEDEFELDTLNNKDSDDEEEKKSATRRRLSKKMNFSQLLEKMKEDAVKERVEQLEQEEREKQKKLSATRRSSSPVLRQSYSAHPSTDVVVVERSALSEPIPPHTQFDPSYSFDDKTEGLIQKDGQKPSTSKEHRDDDDDSSGADDKSKLIKDKSLEDGEEIETDAAKKRKMLYAKLMMIPTFISSLLVSLTLRLHRVSRSYRYVMRALTREKKVLKHSPGFGAGFRSGSNMIWTPIQHAKQSRDSQMGSGTSAATVAVDDVVISRRGSQSSSISSSSSLNCLAQADSQTGMDDRTDRTDHESFISSARFSEELHPMSGIGAAFALMQRERPTPNEDDIVRRRSCIPPEIRILAPSMERGLDDVEDDDNDDGATLKLKSNFDDDGTLKLKSNFDDDDDGAVPLKLESNITSVSKPVDVVLKIDETYEIDEEDFASKEHSIIVELFQAMWYVVLSHTDFICYAMVFLNQINSASVLSLPLPCIVLLWGTLTFPRPSKTFWVTLIAYTQTVVLLKCLCQFEVLWWNQDKILPNQPFAPARILGIERKKGYATYDLILLLVVFCHRIILKSLGLWKSDAVVVEKPNPDVKYKVDEGSADTKAITVGNNSDKLTLTPLTNENGKTDEKDVVVVEEYSDDEDPDFLTLVKISFNKYWSSTREFIRQLFDRQSRKTADVYGFLFLCDFVNFFVILFGFSAFGTQEGDGGIMSYLEENKVPITFLLMLVIQFFLIVVDRALYLRKNMFGKIVYQFILIVGLHIWMFFILPVTTERSFNATNPPVIYYMIKCFHLLFSAYQIRCGYPSRILGNFLTKSFSMLNFAGFKVFINIPFLMELRVLMDWVWTDTTMTLMDWIKMEEIFANIFQLKCSRQMESDLPAPRGQKKGIMAKYLMGGGMILGIILVIWFPMALFAFSAQVGEPNLPYDVSVSLRIGPYEPVYAMSAQDSDIFGLNSDDWVNFNKRYSRSKSALTFLANYEFIDVAAVKLGSNSSTIWNISPPDKDRLLMDLKQNKSLTTRFRYKVMRKSHTKENPGTIEEEQSFEFMGNDTLGTELIKMLESVGNQKTSSIVPFMMPKFIKVKNSGMLRPAHQLLKNLESDDDKANYRNLTLRLFETSISNLTTTQLWWEATESCNEPYYKDIPEDTLYANCHNHITLYLFCDKIFPSTLSSIAGGGIIGLYTTLIFFFSRFLRSTIFSGGSSKIMFDDLPYVDRVLQLCLDIYLVRESLEFTLEEDLYAKLIFLYRSPETMIKWTRPKKEKGDDDTDDSMSTDKKMN